MMMMMIDLPIRFDSIYLSSVARGGDLAAGVAGVLGINLDTRE